MGFGPRGAGGIGSLSESHLEVLFVGPEWDEFVVEDASMATEALVFSSVLVLALAHLLCAVLFRLGQSGAGVALGSRDALVAGERVHGQRFDRANAR